MDNEISVIVPVYKVEKYLQQCIASILGQTYHNFELTLVDDGSPDESGEFSDEQALQNENLISIHQHNGGLSAARNSGIDFSFACSKSQWLTFVDSDDWVSKKYLEVLLNSAKEHNTKVSVAALSDVETRNSNAENDKKPIKSECFNTDDAYKSFNGSNDIKLICAWAKMYRKEIFDEIRYPVGKLYEDRFTTHKALFSTEKIAISTFPVYYYFQNPDSIMHMSWKPQMLNDFEAMEEQLEFFKARNAKYAHKYVVDDYVGILVEHIKMLNEKPEFRKVYEKPLKSKLRELLLLYSGKYNITIDNRYEVWYTAYPWLTKWYCRVRNLPSKIKKLIGKIIKT